MTVIHVEAIDPVINRIISQVDLLRIWPFKKMHERTTETQMFVEFIICSQSKHCFAVETEKCIVFKRNLYRSTGLEASLVKDLNPSDIIISGEIFFSFQHLPSRRHLDGAREYIKCS